MRKNLSCILTSGNWSMKWEISSAVESKCVTLFINFMISWRLWFIGQTQPGCFWIKVSIRTSSGEGCWVSTFDYLHRHAMTNVVSNQKGKKTHPTKKKEKLLCPFPSCGKFEGLSLFLCQLSRYGLGHITLQPMPQPADCGVLYLRFVWFS